MDKDYSKSFCNNNGPLFRKGKRGPRLIRFSVQSHPQSYIQCGLSVPFHRQQLQLR